MTIELFLEYNFTPIFGVIFQVIILIFYKYFSKKEKYIFYAIIILEILEVASYNIEYYYAELPYRTFWRTFYSVIGYITRPALVYPFVILLRDDEHPITSKFKYFDFIPLIIIVLIQQFAFYTNWVFYFTEDNIFKRGPLGFSSQIITIFYMLLAISEVLLTRKKNKNMYMLLVFIIISYVGSAMIVESVTTIRSIGISSAIYSIIFFIFAMLVNNLNNARSELKKVSEVDFLTKISNRYYGESKINQMILDKKIGVFALIDIDKFKSINDNFGHDCGDEAIYKVAQVLKSSLPKNDIVMRLGGDEFAFYSTTLNDEQKLIKIITNIFDELHKIHLTNAYDYKVNISIGIAKFDGTNFDNFSSIYKHADNNLYLAKKQTGNSYII